MLQIIIGSESNNNFHKYIIIYHGKNVEFGFT